MTIRPDIQSSAVSRLRALDAEIGRPPAIQTEPGAGGPEDFTMPASALAAASAVRSSAENVCEAFRKMVDEIHTNKAEVDKAMTALETEVMSVTDALMASSRRVEDKIRGFVQKAYQVKRAVARIKEEIERGE